MNELKNEYYAVYRPETFKIKSLDKPYHPQNVLLYEPSLRSIRELPMHLNFLLDK